jgi:hypothetical protein
MTQRCVTDELARRSLHLAVGTIGGDLSGPRWLAGDA